MKPQGILIINGGYIPGRRVTVNEEVEPLLPIGIQAKATPTSCFADNSAEVEPLLPIGLAVGPTKDVNINTNDEVEPLLPNIY